MFISLFIEEGRYMDIARPNRVCTKYSMNVVENEYHFIFVCPFFSDLRKLCYKCTLVISLKSLHSVNPVPSIPLLYVRIPFEWICRVCIAYIYVIFFSHYVHSISSLYLSLFPFSLSIFPSLSIFHLLLFFYVCVGQ